MKYNNQLTSFPNVSGLRRLLHRPGPALVLGAHDALSAKLAEKVGFDAIWASGFGLSAVNTVPDANILTMSESLNMIRHMINAVRIPIIADCDNGFGNAINVIRTVVEYEQAGVAGICIEDNIFPKRCSFYAGVRRELVSIKEHARKIQAAKGTQKDPDFVVIARTEALIAGWGIQEALKRARAYAEAGADAVLVHSKSATLDELKDFTKDWDGVCPLVAVPTTYASVTVSDLAAVGFKLVIFANQALRASVKAMRETLSVLKCEGRPAAVEDRIATLSEIYELVGVQDLQANEQKFLLSGCRDVTAIIISTDFGKTLLPFNEDRPKDKIGINGKSILEYQIQALNECGVRDIVVVCGNRKEQISLPNVRYYDNDHFLESGELASLFLAEKEMSGGFLFLYSDIVFDPGILEKLLKSQADISIVVDRAWVDRACTQTEKRVQRPDLVITRNPPQIGHRFMPTTESTTIVRIGHYLPSDKADGEFVGLAMFSKEGASLLCTTYHQSCNYAHDQSFHEVESLEKATFVNILQEVIDRGGKVHCVDIYKGWMEIDTFGDYQRVVYEDQLRRHVPVNMNSGKG